MWRVWRVLADEAISVVQLVPSLLAVLLDRAELARALALRLVFCGGEALAPGLAARFRTGLGGPRCINLYGPTEATIDATAWWCGAAEAAGTGTAFRLGVR